MSDSQEPRKITDIIIEKLEALHAAIITLDFNQKLISNKLTELMAGKVPESPKFSVESVNTTQLDPRTIPISNEDALPIQKEPVGFRRTSRPETFAGDNAVLNRPKVAEDSVKFPVQIPRGNKAEVVVPQQIANAQQAPTPPPTNKVQAHTSGNVPVLQRMVDKNGKSLFLADVNIIDNSTKESVFKTRTNGVGKWMASLPLGEYTVVVSKRDSLTKEPLQLSQTFQVDASKSPLELPVCVIKNQG